jgi:F420-dependent oxidoreductase-like protein
MEPRALSRRRFLRGVGAATAMTAMAGRLPWPSGARASTRVPGKLRFGVHTPPQHVGYGDIESVWKEADELGFDTAFVFDHFIPISSERTGPCLEGWTLLASLAAKTRRIRAGVLVTGNTYRYPAVLAKMAATVDHASGGRLILGLGAGWFEREHEAYGIPFHTTGGRARRLVESVEVIKLLFAEEKSNFTGKYYALKDALFEPKSVQKPHPPILIGGMGPKVIQPLAARHANIWHFFVRSGGAEEAKRVCANFDRICGEVGRDPKDVEKCTSLSVRGMTGSAAAELRDQVRALAEAGVGHVLLPMRAPYDRTLLRDFAREVMPAFRST